MSNRSVAAGVRFHGVMPHFRVPNVVRTAEYYRDVLGFQLAGYWDGEQVHTDVSKPAVFGIVRRDEVSIHLNRADAATIPQVPDDGAYDAYFDVSDVDALAEDLHGRGADVLDGPEERVYGRRELVVRDCDGRILGFGEAADERAT